MGTGPRRRRTSLAGQEGRAISVAVVQDRTHLDLRRYKIRVTPQRQAILQYLKSTDSHPTAEQVYEHVRTVFPGISLATVYNTLNLFVQLGLVRELPNGDRSSRFDANVSDHYHLICEGCGAIIDYHGPGLEHLEAKVTQDTGFQVVGRRLDFFGLCPACSA